MSEVSSPAELTRCCANLYELPLTTVLLGPAFHPGGTELTKRLARAALIGRGDRVLDVACGIGESARILAQELGANVVGLDFSAKNIERAAGLSRDARLDARTTFVVGDAEALPFEEERFRTVLCECALCTFVRPEDALREACRVLVPYGCLGLSDVVLNRPLPKVLDSSLGHALCLRGARSIDDYRSLLESTSFGRLQVRDESQTLIEVLDQVESRLCMARSMGAAGTIEIPEGFDEAEVTIAAAREFIKAGGLGYMTMIGRKAKR